MGAFLASSFPFTSQARSRKRMVYCLFLFIPNSLHTLSEPSKIMETTIILIKVYFTTETTVILIYFYIIFYISNYNIMFHKCQIKSVHFFFYLFINLKTHNNRPTNWNRLGLWQFVESARKATEWAIAHSFSSFENLFIL